MTPLQNCLSALVWCLCLCLHGGPVEVSGGPSTSYCDPHLLCKLRSLLVPNVYERFLKGNKLVDLCVSQYLVRDRKVTDSYTQFHNDSTFLVFSHMDVKPYYQRVTGTVTAVSPTGEFKAISEPGHVNTTVFPLFAKEGVVVLFICQDNPNDAEHGFQVKLRVQEKRMWDRWAVAAARQAVETLRYWSVKLNNCNF